VKDALKALGVEKSFDYILIGGTNGKGSTVFMVAEGLQSMGYKVLHTQSPHINYVRERINLNLRPISEKRYERYWEELSHFSLSFFEKHAAMAFLYAVDEGVDVVVGEVGLGGEKDGMNVFPKDIAAIVSLAWDHPKYFQTWNNMIKEKFGILKDAQHYVGVYSPELAHYKIPKHVFNLHYTIKDWTVSWEGTEVNGFFTPMIGTYQVFNLLHAAQILSFYGDSWKLSKKLPRRMEKFSKGYLDGAHNSHAFLHLRHTQELLDLDLPWVIAIKQSKPWKEMLKRVPQVLVYPETLGPGYVDPREVQKECGCPYWQGEEAIFTGTLFYRKEAIEGNHHQYQD